MKNSRGEVQDKKWKLKKKKMKLEGEGEGERGKREKDEKKRGLREARARVDPAYGQQWSARAPCQATADRP